MLKNLIFDWSGTLADDLALTLDATNYVFRQYGHPEITREQFRSEFQLPYPDYYAKTLPQANLDELEDYFREGFRHSDQVVTLIPYAQAFMEFCKARRIRCFSLTSVDSKAFTQQCRELGMIHYFEAHHSGIRHKDQHIHQLLAQHSLNPAETAMIGDMQHDMETAHIGGITAIAVLTGYNNAAQLEKAHPDLIVPNLQSLMQWGESLFSPLPQDHLRIEGLSLPCYIGVPDEERLYAQSLKATVDLVLQTPFHCLHDNIEHAVDYDLLSRRLIAEAQRYPRKLIETLAQDLIELCMHTPGVSHATVTIQKFILPNTDSVSVTISR